MTEEVEMSERVYVSETWECAIHLDELISELEITLLSRSTDDWPMISSVTLDLAEVRDGCLFIARQLWYINTHTQIDEAIARGAAAVLVSQREHVLHLLEGAEDSSDFDRSTYTVGDLQSIPVLYTEHEDPTLGLLCDRFYGYPTSQLKVYGVTGTNGKTSAVSYLAELLRVAGERVMVIGTVAYCFEDRVLPAPNTTPDALVIHRLARQALNLGATALALEVSSHALSLWRIAGVTFDAVGFTSWGRDHLDFHGSLEAYREAKAMLFDVCLAQSIERGKTPVAVAHGDEPGLDMLSRTQPAVTCIRCEVGERALSVGSIQPHERLSLLHLHSEGEPSAQGVTLAGCWLIQAHRHQFPARELPLIGDYHPANLAIALAMVLGTHPECMQALWESLSQTRGVPGRMERVILESGIEHVAQGRVALIDYAHTPDAISRALEALHAVHRGAIHVVIGCGGNRDRGKRPEMTRAALSNADVVWLTSDNPRDEHPEQIIEDALQLGDAWEERVREVKQEIDRRSCLSLAWRNLPPGGALLITGKGHEDYQEMGERRFRLLDAEAIRAAAWSRHHQVDLDDVPLAASMNIDWSIYDIQRRLCLLLTEAIGRPQGLILLITSEDELSEIMTRISDTAQQEILMVDIPDSWSETQPTLAIYEHLWRALNAQLTPRVRSIVWVADNVFLERLLRAARDLAEHLSVSYPYPELTIGDTPSVLVDGPDFSLNYSLGGWPKLRRGPKIPSLL